MAHSRISRYTITVGLMLRLSILLSALVFSLGAESPLSALDPTLPVTAVVSPADPSYHSSLASLEGTAADDVSVSAVEVKIVRESDGYFWDGAAFAAAETWLAASFADPNWSYATLPVWVNGSSYTVISRAQDGDLNYSETYSTAIFHFDTGLPVSSVTVPSNGSAPALFSGISGTAADAEFGIAQVWVKLIRASDNMYWNGATSQWTVAQSWNLAAGTVTWSWAGPPQAAMTIGGTYFAVAAAKDMAGNDQLAEVGASTFTFAGATRPPGCADAISVKSGGSGSYFYIQDALDAMSKDLAGDTCIVVANDGSYSEEVTVQGFTNNGYRLIIMREPAGGSPQVSPPVSSTAVFRIMNASVTIAGFDAIPSGPTPYGVYASSDNVILSSISVVSAGNINLAGIRLAGLSEVSDSAVTADFSHGIRLDGGLNLVARTSAGNNSASYATLYLSGSSSNTVTGSSFSNLGGSAVELLNNSDRNLVDLSTITADSTAIAFHADNSDQNTLTRSYVENPSGYGAFLGFGADGNNVSSSTLVSGAGSYFALKLVSVSSNSVEHNIILNPAGVAYTDVTGAVNSVAHSTISGGGLVFGAAFLDDTYGALVADSFVSGGAGLFVRDSTAAVVADSVLVATIPAYSALRLDSGVSFTAFGNTVVSTGTGILLGAGNLGNLVVTSNTVAGAAVGLQLGLPGAGASLEISSLTFRDMAGASTGVEFTGGQFVSTFTGFAFNGPGLSVNMNSLALAAGSRVTMYDYSGARSGPLYENDPAGYVDWYGADITAPTVAVLQPVNASFRSQLLSLSGTANDNVVVGSVTVSVLRNDTGLYWDGAVWGAAQAWVDASLWPSSWTYTNVPAWVDASSYTIVARAMDSSFNWSAVYSTSVFTYDITLPTAFISAPADALRVSVLPSIYGTAGDALGSDYPMVRIYDVALDKYWMDGTGSCGAASLPGWVSSDCSGFPDIWNIAVGSSIAGGTFSWNYDSSSLPFPDRDAELRVEAKAADRAGNTSVVSSTFSFDSTPPSSAITFPLNGVSYSSAAVASIFGTSIDITSSINSVSIRMWYLSGATTYYWQPTLPHWTASDTGWWAIGGAPGPKSTMNPWTYTSSDFSNPGNANFAWREGTHDGLPGKVFNLATKAVDSTGNFEVNYSTRNFTYVDADTTAPTVAVMVPVHNSVLNSLPELSGTAADNVAVGSVTLSVLNLVSGLYWDGSVWGAAPAWVDASLWPSSWTYTNVPAWVEASSYVVTARAMDLSGNWSVVYATNVFTYDLTAPVAAITAPVTGTYGSFSQLTGTAADAHGIAQVQVSVLRESDGQYWNGAAWAAGPLWNNSTGTLTWNYNGITEAALASGTTYLFNVRAYDAAGNISDPGPVASTFTYVLPAGGTLSPGVFSGIGVSSLTVNWSTTHSTAAVYQVRLSSWAAESPYLYSGSTDTTSITFTGLTPDTSYYGFVSTIPGSGFIASGFGITLASAPAWVDFSSVAYTSATLVWAAGANPAWTVYEFELSTSSDFGAFTSSGSGPGTSADFTGLASWTQYYGRVRAVNGAGLKSAYIEGLTYALTLPILPSGSVTGLAGSALSATTVSWTWNAGTVADADYFAFYDGASVFVGTAAFGATGAYEQAGLTPNSPRLLRVRGRNTLGEGPLVDSATVYTLAALPAAPDFSAVGYSSATLGWADGGNPAGTIYEYEISESNIFSTFVSSGSGTALNKAFTGLLQGATYYGRVRAVNGDSLATAYVSPAGPSITQVLLPSGLVSGLAGSAVGVSSIVWTWNVGTVASADGFALYNNPGVSVGTAAFAASAAYTQAGLGPNSANILRVAGSNNKGEGPLAASATVYTLAQVPAEPVVSQIVLGSAALTLGLNGNPAGTELQLWRSADNISFENVYEGALTAYSDPALAECSPFYYKARARNGAGVYTAFSPTLSFTTMASTPAAPGGFYAEALDGARITLAWEPSPSLSVAGYRLYYDNATGTVDYNTPLNVFTSTVTGWTTPALSANSTYKFALRAAGGCGSEEKNVSLLASAQAVGVLSGVRAAIKVPLAGKRVKGNSVTIVAEIILGQLSQVAQVRFQYTPSGAGAWTDITAANVNHPNPDLAAPYFVHLDADALGAGTYDLRAVATDIYSVADPAAPAITIVVDPVDFDTSESVSAGEQRKEQKINNTVTSTVQAADDTTTLVSKVVIPSGAVNDSTAALTLVNNPAAVPAPPSGADALNLAVKVNLSNGQSLLAAGKTAALTFSYKDDDNNGIVDGTLASVERLKVYTVPDAGGAWTQLATSVDRTNKTITGVTTHFSFFSVFAAPASGLSAIKVYPVPWQPGAGGRFDAAGVTFSNLPATARVKIYTITGELVRLMEVTSADGGIKVWDGRNSEGHKAASGIYLAFIKSGSDERTLKVAVER